MKIGLWRPNRLINRSMICCGGCCPSTGPLWGMGSFACMPRVPLL